MHVDTSAPYDVTLSPSKGASETQDRLTVRGMPASRLSPQALAEAVVFREILKPLARGLGPVGEIAVDGVADALFLRDAR